MLLRHRLAPGLVLLPLALLAAAPAARAAADTAPAPGGVLRTMRAVNGYFMAACADPGQPVTTTSQRPGAAPRTTTRASNLWTRGVYYEGLMALARVDPDPRYTDYAVRWSSSHAWGLIGGVTTVSADNQCCGQTYLDLYAQDPQPERIRDLQASAAAMVAAPKTDTWWWCDALQMAMPVFARLGVLNHDPRYFEKLHALYEDTKTSQGGHGLYNPAEHLWWRDKTFVAPYQEPNGRNSYWARGNGWVLAALVRTLEVLPPDAPHRDEYVRNFQDMAAALLPLQRSDGYWNVSLLDPGHFGGKEVTGTSLFVYGFAAGIRLGLLPAKDYQPAVFRAWNAMAAEAVHPDGFLGYVQGTGKQPSDSQPVGYDHKPDFEDFGVGCFLLGGSEVWKLAGGR
jgi:unsaturated rhamnogalacturonyl hydrolase